MESIYNQFLKILYEILQTNKSIFSKNVEKTVIYYLFNIQY